jgi:hypothetical protein
MKSGLLKDGNRGSGKFVLFAASATLGPTQRHVSGLKMNARPCRAVCMLVRRTGTSLGPPCMDAQRRGGQLAKPTPSFLSGRRPSLPPSFLLTRFLRLPCNRGEDLTLDVRAHEDAVPIGDPYRSTIVSWGKSEVTSRTLSRVICTGMDKQAMTAWSAVSPLSVAGASPPVGGPNVNSEAVFKTRTRADRTLGPRMNKTSIGLINDISGFFLPVSPMHCAMPITLNEC